jgi:hypothetical protein
VRYAHRYIRTCVRTLARWQAGTVCLALYLYLSISLALSPFLFISLSLALDNLALDLSCSISIYLSFSHEHTHTHTHTHTHETHPHTWRWFVQTFFKACYYISLSFSLSGLSLDPLSSIKMTGHIPKSTSHLMPATCHAWVPDSQCPHRDLKHLDQACRDLKHLDQP